LLRFDACALTAKALATSAAAGKGGPDTVDCDGSTRHGATGVAAADTYAKAVSAFRCIVGVEVPPCRNVYGEV
jgi:hypothetical protein